MRRPAFIARQSRCPTGLIGLLVAWVMRRETSAANDAALDNLDLEADDRFLEIGFGHGRTLERAAGIAHDGEITGIEISETMLRSASRRLRRFGKRVQLLHASSDSIPCASGFFDKALAMHTIYFWNSPEQHLRELHRVLKPGGILILGFTSAHDARAVASFPPSIYRFYTPDEITSLLSAAGFDDVELLNAGNQLLATSAARSQG